MNTRQRRSSVALKLLLAIAIAIVIIVGAQTAINIRASLQREEETEERDLKTYYGDYESASQAIERTAATLAIGFADRPDVQQLFLAHDRAGLQSLLTPLFNILKIDYKITNLLIEEPDGAVFVRIHDPQLYGDDVSYRRTVAAVMELPQTTTGIEIGATTIGMRGVSPIFKQGAMIGMAEVGMDYDLAFLESLKAKNNADYKIWVDRAAAAQAGLVEPRDGAPAPPIPELFYYASTKPASLPISSDVYRRVLSNKRWEITRVSAGGQEMAVLIAPLLASGNRLVGILEISAPRTQSLADLRQNVITTLVTSAVLILIASGLMGLLILLVVVRPVGHLANVARQQLAGDQSARARLRTGDELEQLGATLNTLTEQLGNTLRGLESTVAERTQDLERRSHYLQASTQVSRAAASILDPAQLIGQMVELIREQFGLYYVGLFLLDESGQWAILRAGTGSAGQKMIERGHKRQVGEGMIGWSIANARARVTLQAGQDAVRLGTPELPDTRSEAALPLRSRGQVIGALTVQSDQAGVFDQDEINMLQVMADQVAVALDNARLFAESQAALEASRRAYGELTRQAWSQLIQARPEQGYRYAQRAITPAQGEWRPELAQAAQSGQSVQQSAAGEATLAVPLRVRDQVIGALRFSKANEWLPEEVAVIEALTEQLGLALDSARLYQDTQRRAAREQLTSEITTRMRESLDIERVLQTAARELGEATGALRVDIKLETGNAQ